jgi:hypothetical protein
MPSPLLLSFLKTHSVAYEILGIPQLQYTAASLRLVAGTVNALSTFNFLAAEGRIVVGEQQHRDVLIFCVQCIIHLHHPMVVQARCFQLVGALPQQKQRFS